MKSGLLFQSIRFVILCGTGEVQLRHFAPKSVAVAEGQVLLTRAGVWLICDLADSILIGVFDYYDVDVSSQGRSYRFVLLFQQFTECALQLFYVLLVSSHLKGFMQARSHCFTALDVLFICVLQVQTLEVDVERFLFELLLVEQIIVLVHLAVCDACALGDGSARGNLWLAHGLVQLLHARKVIDASKHIFVVVPIHNLLVEPKDF